jgi:hypothetical protein
MDAGLPNNVLIGPLDSAGILSKRLARAYPIEAAEMLGYVNDERSDDEGVTMRGRR